MASKIISATAFPGQEDAVLKCVKGSLESSEAKQRFFGDTVHVTLSSADNKYTLDCGASINKGRGIVMGFIVELSLGHKRPDNRF